METGEPADGTQFLGIIWSFFVVYGVWVLAVVLLVAAVVGALFMMRDRREIEKKPTAKQSYQN